MDTCLKVVIGAYIQIRARVARPLPMKKLAHVTFNFLTNPIAIYIHDFLRLIVPLQ